MHIFVYIDRVKKEIPDKYYIPMNNVEIVFLLSYLFMLSPDILDYLYLIVIPNPQFGWIRSALLTFASIVGFRTWPEEIPVCSMMVIVGQERPRLLRDSIQAETDCVKIIRCEDMQRLKMALGTEVNSARGKWGWRWALGQYRKHISQFDNHSVLIQLSNYLR